MLQGGDTGKEKVGSHFFGGSSHFSKETPRRYSKQFQTSQPLQHWAVGGAVRVGVEAHAESLATLDRDAKPAPPTTAIRWHLGGYLFHPDGLTGTEQQDKFKSNITRMGTVCHHR